MNQLTWLNHFKWKNRMVIVMINSPHNEDYIVFKKDYEKHLSGVVERKMVRKTIIQPRLNPAFQISLYTLDGKLAHRIKKSISVEEIFSLIDKMHLRKAELKKLNRANVIRV